MSIGTLKSGSDYADLKVVDGKDFSPEQYGIALRKDSPETLKKLNDAIQAVADDGTLDKIAEKYSLLIRCIHFFFGNQIIFTKVKSQFQFICHRLSSR